MFKYRPFLNTDPPQLITVWNESLTGRGSFPLRSPNLLERWVFSKPYFDPTSLIVAESEETGVVAGFSLHGFGPDDSLSRLESSRGVIAATLVRPEFRRKGLGRELFRRSERYLRESGAKSIRFGALPPNNPYLFGLYGGAHSVGVLDSEPLAAPFLTAMGYSPGEGKQVFHKSLDEPIVVADQRFAQLRRNFEGQFLLRGAEANSWWQECVWGTLEASEVRLIDRVKQLPVARAIVWELEGFGWRWGCPSAGVYDVWVHPDYRKQGIAKLILIDILRVLQEQFFGIAELHVPDGDPAGNGLCRTLGFRQVDFGREWLGPPEE